MGTRRRLALLIGQPEENQQSLFIKGFLKEAFDCDFDVCIFAMYQKFQDTKEKEQGESNIFSLVDCDSFDGFVVMSDTIQTPGVLDWIEEKLYQSKKPVICIDGESKYFRSVTTNHYTPAKQLVEHLIEEHGFTDIAYLTGKEFHPHSKQRLQAFLDCMEEHGLTVADNRVFYGDFWYSSGISVAKQLLHDKEHLPQAVACANDCMAIGLAGELVKGGVRVPEDIAVTGYDVLPEARVGRDTLTSAPVPAEECGAHAIRCINAIFAGEEMPEFNAKVELCIGSSCGCGMERDTEENRNSGSWDIEGYQESFQSRTNYMASDLLLQTDENGVINTIFSYVHQIKPFDGFHICLNTDWAESAASSCGYTEKLLHALGCNESRPGDSKVDLTARYDKKQLIESLFEVEDYPKAYTLTPLYFEKRCFGFAAISYGKETRCYTEKYRVWLETIIYNLEYFRRVNVLKKENVLLKAAQVRDPVTGLYNYNGFMESCMDVLGKFPNATGYADVIAIDILGLNDIGRNNTVHGSNKIISDFSRILLDNTGSGVRCSFGNGEFLVTMFSVVDGDSMMSEITEKIQKQLDTYNDEKGLEPALSIVVGGSRDSVSGAEEFERLVNKAVSIKNGNRARVQKNSQIKLSAEEQKNVDVVSDILDNNRLTYHFQPIVDARTGEIFAYEALMRSNTEQFVSPLEILKFAEYLGRLYDVERATFLNVLECIENHEEEFIGKKIFINSIPGNRLKPDDFEMVKDRLEKYSGKVVIELTEQAELDDDELAKMKADYERVGVETAVDDYGTGYSNVTNLLRYMPNCVKIDRMLLSNIQLSPQKQHFVKEIIEFAHDNNIKTLAEGVETSEELKMVISLGVDLIQGFYTAKPSAEICRYMNHNIQNEIIQYSQLTLEQSGRKVYNAGTESSISLVKLVTGKYSGICFGEGNMPHRDIKIVGLPGFQANMDIVVKDSYTGRIELQDVDLGKHNNQPGIKLGKNCDVTLVLTGENILEQGGVLVPESSKLTVQGDGDLFIKQIATDGYGIGNSKNERHGDLYFEQDGAIEISGNTMHGVGIGSGYGGNIYINRGKYVIKLAGEEAVGVGSLYADMNQEVKMCEMDFNIANATSVGIGSLEGNVNLSISHVGLKASFGGNECTGIGTIRGEKCKIFVEQASLDISARSERLCGLGNMYGAADITIESALYSASVQGKKAIAMGNTPGNASIYVKNSDLVTTVKNNLGVDVGAEVFEIVNGRCDFKLNGKEVERESIEGDL
ncbi:MAG: EAL domain-containing protein [Clostridium sp.]|nr:EAL domain-containing protein [Clostridium sp.]MCM1398613.1 EAL domain-containing protein [Clostridium sp.]MCM1459899.1 EAL domain-containing protein [Bacteroides sp.]